MYFWNRKKQDISLSEVDHSDTVIMLNNKSSTGNRRLSDMKAKRLPQLSIVMAILYKQGFA